MNVMEWNEALSLAHHLLENELPTDTWKCITMETHFGFETGSRGIKFNVHDCDGNLFSVHSTSACTDVRDLCKSIKDTINKMNNSEFK